jgi:hypothetical protein
MLDFDYHLIPYAFALLIALPFFVLLRQFVHHYISLKEKELKLISIKANGDVKMQAYERMTLFLERLKPSSLVEKFNKELAIHEYIFLLEKSISEEFDYNSSQQLYISKNSWQNIVTCKNNILNSIRKTYENMSNSATLQDFKTVFLMDYMNGEDYISQTIEDLRKDAILLS